MTTGTTQVRILELTMRSDGEIERIPEHDACFAASIARGAGHLGITSEEAMRRLDAGEELVGAFCTRRFVDAD